MSDARMVIAYTDGSCFPNPNGHGGWAYLVKFGKMQLEDSGYLSDCTNNIAEMTAVLKLAQRVNPSRFRLCITTDSKYVQNCLTVWHLKWVKQDWKNWEGKPVSNVDLIKETLAALKRHEGKGQGGWEMHWIKGHAGHYYNERVDQLASAARISQGKKL